MKIKWQQQSKGQKKIYLKREMNWSIGWMWRLLKCVKLKHGMKTKDEREAKCHIHKHEHQEV